MSLGLFPNLTLIPRVTIMELVPRKGVKLGPDFGNLAKGPWDHPKGRRRVLRTISMVWKIAWLRVIARQRGEMASGVVISGAETSFWADFS